jgi:hypothetical protein
MKTIPFDEFNALLKAQGVSGRMHYAFKCPMCATVQSGADFVKAGFPEWETKLGFSCIGRVTGAPAPRKEPDGKPCNWTLGGLFRMHKLEVTTPDGKVHFTFEPATPEEAQRHEQEQEAAK